MSQGIEIGKEDGRIGEGGLRPYVLQISCVTLGKLLYFSEFVYSIPQNSLMR